jgi:hypothetical protein
MIRDASKLKELQETWQSVRTAEATIKAASSLPFVHAEVAMHYVREYLFDLMLVYVFSVLDDVLRQLRDEGVFTSKGTNLKALMDGSRSALPWVDFALVGEARNRRNDVAHRRQHVPPADCARYIDAIEAELVA